MGEEFPVRIPAESEPCVRFGKFELDLSTRELRADGRGFVLQEQPFQILAALLERPGHLVTRNELKHRLWSSDTFVDFERSLNKAVNRLREVLEETADQPRFIETLHRQGYRFIAPVECLSEASKRQASAPGKRPQSLPAKPWHRKFATKTFAGILASALIVSVSLKMGWKHGSSTIHSIAVLPLENLSGDPSQDYFADGMTDELITDLGQISALRVISRTSVMQYKRERKPLPQIARQLNADAIVEGTVLRSGDRVRITAQLIQAASDKHLWAHTYEGSLSDVLGLQNLVAADIADQIRIKLTAQERAVLKSTRIAKPAAYEAYLKGRYFWDERSKEGITKAIRYFEEAIRDDPSFALPYAGLSQVYAALPDYMAIPPRECYGKAKVAATKALKLDDTLAEAHTALGGITLTNDYDWPSSEREFQRAIQLNPGYAGAYHWHAINLMFMSKWEEAIAEIEQARQLDPLSIIINANIGFVYYHARRFDDAIAAERTALELDSNNPVAYEYMGLAYLEKKMYEEAITNLRKAFNLSGGVSENAAELSFAYAANGDWAEARKILVSLEDRSRHEYVPSFSLAVTYAGLGDKNRALAYLQKAYNERCDLVPTIKVSPLFESLHSEPRFQELLHKVGFPGQAS
jgi:TolB-like protein/DNA-binding winged helix-turn-helix (wHTH) protein/Flp pilus assembly protein TadD